jgi:hypothetical protein
MSSSGIFKMVDVGGTLRRVEEFIIELTPPSSPELSDYDTESELESNEDIEEFSLDGSDSSYSYVTARSRFSSRTFLTSLSRQESQTDMHGDDQQVEHHPDPEAQRVLDVQPEPEVQNEPEVQQEPEDQYEEPSPLFQPLEALRVAILEQQSPRIIERIRQVILNYLHREVATLAEVQLLVPEISHDTGITNKLVTNLGYNYAGFRIPEAKMTLIREYLFTSAEKIPPAPRSPQYWRFQLFGNHPYRLLDAVETKCEQFRKSMVTNRLSQQITHRQQLRAEAAEAPQHRLTRQQIQDQIKEFPLHMQISAEIPDLLPIGASSAAEIYVKIHGFSWAETEALGDSTRPYRRLIPVGDPVELESHGKYFAYTKTIFWYGRRAHRNRNGTLRPTKPDRPSLPPASAYRIRPMVDTSRIPEFNQRGSRFASMRQSLESIELRHDGTTGTRKIVVRLPPRETVMAATPAQNPSPRATAVAIPRNLPIRSTRARSTTTQDGLHSRQEQQSNSDNE